MGIAGGGLEAGDLKRVADLVRRGKCILFLGAGVHRVPPADSKYSYPEADAPPTGWELCAQLAKASGYPDFNENCPCNLQRVAHHFEVTCGREALAQAVRNAVSNGKVPSAAVRGLAAMKFPVVITTNYDQLFEDALRVANKRPELSIYAKGDNVAPRDIEGDADPDDRPFVLKMHGDVDDKTSFVITDEDYIDFVLRMGAKERLNPVPLNIRALLTRRPILFIGYSLADYNLRLLFKTLHWAPGIDRGAVKRSYSVDPKPDPLIVRTYAEGPDAKINFIVQDVWTFVPALYREVTGQEMPQ